MQKQRLLHLNTNKRNTLPVQNLIVREFTHAVSDRRIVGTCETRYRTTSQWRPLPTGALREGQEAAEETREDRDLTAPTRLFHTDINLTAADPFALRKLSWIQNYLLSTGERENLDVMI